MSLDGILLVDKPAGLSSAAVVRRVKRALGAAKVGHLGTLDPFATGLLPLCLGEGAKVVPFLNEERKGYEGTIELGVATDTLDRTGAEVERAPVPAIDAATLERGAAGFRGAISQVPPMYSALKRAGVPLYELARRGVEVEREPRSVTIERFEVRLAGEGRIDFEVDCSKGTYVRVLAADLARALGTVGHLSSLRRVRFGEFTIEEAVPLDAVESGEPLPLLSPRRALSGAREIAVDADFEKRIRLGQQWALRELPPPASSGDVAKAVGDSGDVVAILVEERGGWRIARVLA